MKDETVNGITFTRGSGNVFADLGFENADDMLRKADIVIALQRSIAARGLSQTAAAKRIGIAQPDLSKLLRGHTDGFSYDRLLTALTRLGNNVTITIKPAATNAASGKIAVDPSALKAKPARQSLATTRKKAD